MVDTNNIKEIKKEKESYKTSEEKVLVGVLLEVVLNIIVRILRNKAGKEVNIESVKDTGKETYRRNLDVFIIALHKKSVLNIFIAKRGVDIQANNVRESYLVSKNKEK